MSLTATLLLNKPIIFPDGVKQPPHYISRPELIVVVSETTYKKRLALREMNIANVLTAIEEGIDTIPAIAKYLAISKSTVLNAVNRLQDREQIECIRGKNWNGAKLYRFKVIK